MPLPLAAALIPSAIQAGTSIYQMVKGGRMKAPQSDATVPAAYQDRINKLKMREATEGKLPGQDALENKLTASTATGIDAMKEAGNQANFGNTVAQYVQAEQDKLADIGIAAARRKDEMAMDTVAAMKDLEGYQQDIQSRKFEKEGAKLAEKNALMGSGMQNLMGAATSAASTAATYAGGGNRTTKDNTGSATSATATKSSTGAKSTIKDPYAKGLTGNEILAADAASKVAPYMR